MRTKGNGGITPTFRAYWGLIYILYKLQPRMSEVFLVKADRVEGYIPLNGLI